MKTDDTEAVRVVVFGLPTMSKARRRRVAQFLRSRATVIEKFGDIQVTEYAGRFTQRLYLNPEPARPSKGSKQQAAQRRSA